MHVRFGHSFDATAIPVPISTGTFQIPSEGSGPPLTITFSQNRWGERQGYLFCIDDSTADVDLKRGAINDPLTTLPNRVLFFDQLTDAMKRDCESGEELAVLFMDLDGFKSLNDEYGHLVGDEVLRVVADRIKSEIRFDDFVARLGGDEFALIAKNASVKNAELLAERIHEAVSKPIHVDNLVLRVDISIGVAHASAHEDKSSDDILALADQAMYQEKTRARDTSPSRPSRNGDRADR